jgi:hypothetical protein
VVVGVVVIVVALSAVPVATPSGVRTSIESEGRGRRHRETGLKCRAAGGGVSVGRGKAGLEVVEARFGRRAIRLEGALRRVEQRVRLGDRGRRASARAPRQTQQQRARGEQLHQGSCHVRVLQKRPSSLGPSCDGQRGKSIIPNEKESKTPAIMDSWSMA